MTFTTTTPPQQIARAIAQHCSAEGIAESRFGRIVCNDPRLIGDLRAGRLPRPAKVEKINAALAGEAFAWRR
jgi:hypothetical protein